MHKAIKKGFEKIKKDATTEERKLIKKDVKMDKKLDKCKMMKKK